MNAINAAELYILKMVKMADLMLCIYYTIILK